ncbi:MAG: MFS transporter [Gaiellaceae bacterium]
MSGGLKGARLGLLRDAPGFRFLFFATLASSLGTWLALVALVVDVFDRTDDANWVSALLIVEFLPIVVIGLAAGPLLDRLPRRLILVGSDLARAVVFCLLPFAGSALQIVLLAFVAGVATSVFRPAQYAGLPNLVSDRDLPQANGLLQSADNVTWALGSLVGGALVAATSPEVAYWLNAATFLLSALLLVRIRESLEEEREPGRGGLRDLAEGLGVAVRSRPLLTVLVAWSIVMLGNAGVNVAEVVLAKDVFSAGDFGYGLLLAAAGVGLLLGSLYGTPWIDHRGIRTVYVTGIALMAIGIGAAAGAPNVWVAALAVVVGGAGNGVAVVCNALLVQRGAPDRLRGRAFTVVMSVGYAVLGLGMVAAGPLTNVAGARTVWGISGALFAVAAVVGLVLLRDAPVGVTRPGEPVPVEESPTRVG